ncbi:putative ubiquitinyl hydrolase 1 [Helianthus debilis subsp. tardiflorus]
MISWGWKLDSHTYEFFRTFGNIRWGILTLLWSDTTHWVIESICFLAMIKWFYVAHAYKGRWMIFDDDKVGVSKNPPKDIAYLSFIG